MIFSSLPLQVELVFRPNIIVMLDWATTNIYLCPPFFVLSQRDRDRDRDRETGRQRDRETETEKKKRKRRKKEEIHYKIILHSSACTSHLPTMATRRSQR